MGRGEVVVVQLFPLNDFVAPFLTGGGVHGTTTVVPNTLSSALLVPILAVTCIEGALHLSELSELVAVEFSSKPVIVSFCDERGHTY